MRFQLQTEPKPHSLKLGHLTDAIKILIAVNLILFLFKTLAPHIEFSRIFGLSPQTVWPQIWEPFTYLFIHDTTRPWGFLHVVVHL